MKPWGKCGQQEMENAADIVHLVGTQPQFTGVSSKTKAFWRCRGHKPLETTFTLLGVSSGPEGQTDAPKFILIRLSSGDKIQGPSWGQRKKRKPPFWQLLDPRFEWLEGGLKVA